MKLKKRRNKSISPNNLTLSELSKPIKKVDMIIFGVSFAILIICFAILKANIAYSLAIDVIIMVLILISATLSMSVPIKFVANKLLKEEHKNDFDDEDDNEDQNYYELDDDEEEDEDDDDENFDYEYEQYLENNLI